jgi:chemotaxis protein methyltransferase CheR
VATFLVANIFDETLPDRLGQFDFLFSRNMLIYFNHEEKRRCFDQLYKLLKPGGYLFLGHADSNGIDKTRFRSLRLGSPIYQKI